MEELRKLNFNKLISVGIPDVTSYSYNEYREIMAISTLL